MDSKNIKRWQNIQNPLKFTKIDFLFIESGDEGNADLSVQRGQIPVFLASGQGPRPEMSRAERLEFAMVDLMAGASEIEGKLIFILYWAWNKITFAGKSSSTNLTTTSMGTTSTVQSSTTDGPTTIIEVMSTTTAAIPLQKVETTTAEDVNDQTKQQSSIDSQVGVKFIFFFSFFYLLIMCDL
jgi:hypothetical protein